MKKGVSQLDWIISLALFVLYIGWFFVFIIPNLNIDTNKNSVIFLLKTNFQNEFNWKIDKYPIFINYNETSQMKPVIIDFDRNTTSIRFMDNTKFMLWQKKLIFLANISEGTAIVWLLEGANSTQGYQLEGLNIGPDWASTENLSVSFEDSLISTASYKDDTKINNIYYELNGVPLANSPNYYNDSGFVAIYGIELGNINHSSLIFAYNTEIYNFVGMADAHSTYNLKLDLDLDNYDSYYSDNNYFGEFEYKNSTYNINYTHDILTLVDSDNSFTLIFDDDVEFNLSFYNSTLNLGINIPISANYQYKYIFHEMNTSSITKTQYDAKLGGIHTLSGIHLNNMSSNYSRLKTKWNFPNDIGFQIQVFENTSSRIFQQFAPIVEIGDYDPKNRNVYAESEDAFALGDDGMMQPISIIYRIW